MNANFIWLIFQEHRTVVTLTLIVVLWTQSVRTLCASVIRDTLVPVARAVPTITTAIQKHLAAHVKLANVTTTPTCTDLETVILRPADVCSVCTTPTVPTVKCARLTTTVMLCSRTVNLVSVTYSVPTPGLDLATTAPVSVLVFLMSLDRFVISVRRTTGKSPVDRVAILASAMS